MYVLIINTGLPQWLKGKKSAFNAGDTGDTSSISGSGRSPGGGHGKSLQDLESRGTIGSATPGSPTKAPHSKDKSKLIGMAA